MKKRIVLLAALQAVFLMLTSCNKEGEEIITGEIDFEVPATYVFERNGASSADYTGQTQRLLMLGEIDTYVKSAAKDGNVTSAATLLNMYSNSNSPFTDTDLNNATTKKLKDKTAASQDYFVNYNGGGSSLEQSEERSFFESQFTALESASNGADASSGVAGKYIDGTSVRLFDKNGLEPVQVVLKGMMGAVFLDQVVNNYLSVNKLDAGNNKTDNTNKVLDGTSNYTKMEHAWDEAYGYIYGAGGGKFWDKYINEVNADVDFNTIKEDIANAFRIGRAAIVANNYSARDKQIAIIKEKLAVVAAVRSVFYLMEGKSKLTVDNGKKAFHALSEGYGFIKCLRYTQNPNTGNPYFTKSEVDDLLRNLTSGTNGFYDVDYLNNKLEDLASTIAAKFGFSVTQAQTVN